MSHHLVTYKPSVNRFVTVSRLDCPCTKHFTEFDELINAKSLQKVQVLQTHSLFQILNHYRFRPQQRHGYYSFLEPLNTYIGILNILLIASIDVSCVDLRNTILLYYLGALSLGSRTRLFNCCNTCRINVNCWCLTH